VDNTVRGVLHLNNTLQSAVLLQCRFLSYRSDRNLFYVTLPFACFAVESNYYDRYLSSIEKIEITYISDFDKFTDGVLYT